MNSVIFDSLYDLAAAGWRRRYLMLIPMLILPLFGLLISNSGAKQYHTHTSFLLQETAALNPFLEDWAVSTNLKDRMSALKRLLNSRHVLTEVAEELGMIDEESSDGRRNWVIGQLSSKLSVELAGRDYVTLGYTDSDPSRMAEVVEVAARRFIDTILAPEKSSIVGSERFLAEQLESKRGELEAAEQALADYKSSNASTLPELHSGNVQRLRQVREQLSDRETRLAGAHAELSTLRSKLSRVDPIVGRLEEQIVGLRGELALLRARYTDEHSAVQAILSRLAHLEEERGRLVAIAKELSEADLDRLWSLAGSRLGGDDTERVAPLLVSQLQELQAAVINIQRLEKEVTRLRAEAEDLAEKVARYGQTERTLGELERDLRVKRSIYEELLARYEKAQLTGALGRFEAEERIKIITRPYTPTVPLNPPALLFIIAGLFGGIALGAGLAIVIELTDTTIRRRDALERLCEVAVLSRIPAISTAGAK